MLKTGTALEYTVHLYGIILLGLLDPPLGSCCFFRYPDLYGPKTCANPGLRDVTVLYPRRDPEFGYIKAESSGTFDAVKKLRE